MRTLPPSFAAFALGLTGLASALAAEPAPPFVGKLTLVRFDQPIAFSNGYAPTRQTAKMRNGPDAIVWPDFTLNGRPVFRGGKSEEELPFALRADDEATSPFQLPTDEVIQPGNHWLRPMEWRRGLRHLYTADATARTANTASGMAGRYELWLFPVLLQGEGGPVVKNVELKVGGRAVFRQPGPWRSLTLLLPQNEKNQPYVLTVDGRPPTTFSVGLQPVRLGNPRESVISTEARIRGSGPAILLRDLDPGEAFPHAREWAADVASLASPVPASAPLDRGRGPARYLGRELSASPLTLYAAGLPLGMSGGFFKKGTDPEAYAQLLAGLGFDTVFDPASWLPAPADPESFENRAAALARHQVRLGLQYDQNWTRPALQHPNVTFFAHTLADWHAPLYRSLSLAAQRFSRLPNFAGFCIGADNAGYASHWSWARPVPDRPWGPAMIAFTGSNQPRLPRAPSLGPVEFAFEEPVKTQAEFTKYVERYDLSFQQNGYFAEAVREVSPRLVFTTGTFGSAPGAGARGGWPWASIPGRVLAEGLPVQQAYDWNVRHAAKPLHCVALADRLHSYFPKKITWGLLDNHHFLYGREAWQRACALLLTRGVQGVGTNFLPRPDGEGARPDVVASLAEMNAWMRKFGGVYARSEPQAVIGIFFGQLQATQRRVLTAENPSPEELLRGSHEGKVAEALFFCHAAGWPARVITYQELLRGPLPASMKALLLVGLDPADDTWSWGTGLDPTLQKFLDRGGRILADDESACPVPSIKTGMKVAAYVAQSDIDPTPLLLARNAVNIGLLRAAMEGVAPPVAVSTDERLWAIPTLCGDTEYVTVVNQAFAEGDEARERVLPVDPKATTPEPWKFKGNASLFVKPQTGTLQWNTTRPIYDVRLQRRLTAEEAAQVDLTKDGFRWYALPPREIVAPELAVELSASGFYEARVKIPGGPRLGGVPVQITVAGVGDPATVYSSTEIPTRLPLRSSDAGEYTVTASELLTGLTVSTKVNVSVASDLRARLQVQVRDAAAVARFPARKRLPLTIALTPNQERDPLFVGHANALKAFYEKSGRTVTVGTVAPGGVVESLQPLRSPHRYPQWKTIPQDLILFGTPADNVLIRDQARGEILPRDFLPKLDAEAVLLYARSAFVGECDVLNIVAHDTAGYTAAVARLTSPPTP